MSQVVSRDMALAAVNAYEAIKRPSLKCHIDEVGKTLYGINSDMFVIPKNDGCTQ